MTKSERDLLLPFLSQLVSTRTTPADKAAQNLIQSALQRQPHAPYLLVQRALSLESELAIARRRIQQLEGREPAPEVAAPAADFLNLQTAGWGEVVDRNAGVTASKRLYDFFKQANAAREMDLESRAVSFIGQHAGRIWLLILAIAATVVMFKESLV
jgi:hypothetical protein